MKERVSHSEIAERLVAVETTLESLVSSHKVISAKLDGILPAVKENSWWIEKIKWGFVFCTIVGLAGGIIALAIRNGT